MSVEPDRKGEGSIDNSSRFTIPILAGMQPSGPIWGPFWGPSHSSYRYKRHKSGHNPLPVRFRLGLQAFCLYIAVTGLHPESRQFRRIFGSIFAIIWSLTGENWLGNWPQLARVSARNFAVTVSGETLAGSANIAAIPNEKSPSGPSVRPANKIGVFQPI